MTQRGPGSERDRSGYALLAVVSAASVGAAVGLGLFTFVYAQGASYLTDDPAACANCHVMRGHLDAWAKGSHAVNAGCNDCHAPHGFVAKYYGKARNGLLHSVAFTTGAFPQNLQMNAFNHDVTEAACRACHGDFTHSIDVGLDGAGNEESVSCIRCHETVGHDR